MRLLVLTQDFYPNISGGALSRWKFCQQAVRRGHDVTVLTPRQNGMQRTERAEGVEIVRPFPPHPDWVSNYSAVATIFRLLYTALVLAYALVWMRDRRYDGVLSMSNSTHWLASTLGRLYECRVGTFFGYTPSIENGNGSWFKSVLQRANLRLFLGDIVFFRATETGEILRSRGVDDARQVHGILHTDRLRDAKETDPSAVRSRLGIDKSTRILVSVGRLVPIKNPPALVDLVSALPVDYSLVIVGDGPARDDVRQRIRETDTADRIEIVGEQPHQKTLEIVAAADAMVVTSEAESYCGAALEGLSLSRPVFATPVGILPEVEHPDLHLASVEALPELITERSLNHELSVDADIIKQYSMERFTTAVLRGFIISDVEEVTD